MTTLDFAPAVLVRRPGRVGARAWVHRTLAALAWVYVGCLTIQVLLAGMGLFVNPIWFQRHRAFVHEFGWLA